MFVYIDNHDEAMKWAQNKVFDVNRATSAIQVVDLEIGKKGVVQSETKIDWAKIMMFLMGFGIKSIIYQEQPFWKFLIYFLST